MKQLIDYIKYYVSLSKEAEDTILNTFKVKEYEKDQTILMEGNTCKALYFVLEGTIRTFYRHNGKEITTWIYPNGFFVTAWTSFLLGKASFESIASVQKTTVASISKGSLLGLYDKFPDIERFGRLLAEEQLAAIDEYSKGYYLLSAKEKYDKLLSFFPDVVQRTNLGHIASMLGVSQETLSRIRKERD